MPPVMYKFVKLLIVGIKLELHLSSFIPVPLPQTFLLYLQI